MSVIEHPTQEEDELPTSSRLLPTATSRIGLVAAIVLFVVTPLVLEDDFWMTVLANAAAFAIAGIGLNILTGYAGQVSIGHAAFLTMGGYTVAYLGAEKGWPLPLWLAAAAVVGGVIGALVAPFALPSKRNSLVVVPPALLLILSRAVANWGLQKEPQDAALVLRAAIAAKAPERAAPIVKWVERSGLEDVSIEALIQRLKKG